MKRVRCQRMLARAERRQEQRRTRSLDGCSVADSCPYAARCHRQERDVRSSASPLSFSSLLPTSSGFSQCYARQAADQKWSSP